MSARQAMIAIAGLLLTLAAGCKPNERAAEDEITEELIEPVGDDASLRLFFPSAAGALAVEERPFPTVTDGEELVRVIVGEILAGPSGEGLQAPFVADVELGSVYISASGIAFVDLVSSETHPPRSGSRQEMLSVYSIVNSVHESLPNLAGVVLLWNGQQRPTFAGHLDTGRPLRPKPDLIDR